MADREARRAAGIVILGLGTVATLASLIFLSRSGSALWAPLATGLAGMAFGTFLIRFSHWRWP